MENLSRVLDKTKTSLILALPKTYYEKHIFHPSVAFLYPILLEIATVFGNVL